MTWSTTQIEYEGFPLLLRKPDYNIWKLRPQFPQLLSIKHPLKKVSPNGLPDSKYNKTLFSFDADMVSLLAPTDGLIFLIETFAGKRIYYYYTTHTYKITPSVAKLKEHHKVDLIVTEKVDANWDFINGYPVELFP